MWVATAGERSNRVEPQVERAAFDREGQKMHLLFLNHNGRADKNRPNTLRLLTLISKNLHILKQLDARLQIYAMTDTQISDNYETLKRYKIKEFPTLIINNKIEGQSYSDIYNIYNNEFNRVSKSSGDHTVVEIEGNEDDEDDSNMDGMDYIMSQMGKPDDPETENDVSEAMGQEDIKKGMSKFDGKSKSVTKKFESTSLSSDTRPEPEIGVAPSGGEDMDDMEAMMMQKMMDNI